MRRLPGGGAVFRTVIGATVIAVTSAVVGWVFAEIGQRAIMADWMGITAGSEPAWVAHLFVGIVSVLFGLFFLLLGVIVSAVVLAIAHDVGDRLIGWLGARTGGEPADG